MILKIKLSRLFISFILIITGVLLLLTNLGILSRLGITHMTFGELWQYVYSVLFIIIGLKFIYDFIKSRRGQWKVGSFLLIFGSLLLLGSFEIINFQFKDIFKLWPLLIIYIGFSLIGWPKRKSRSSVHVFTDDSYKDKGWNVGRFSVGDHEFKHPNWKVEPMELWNMAGDYYIDFSKAFIPEEEIPITIDCWAGDIQILMPEHVEFKVIASVKAGEINVLGQKAEGINRELVFTSPDFDTATRKLDLALHLKAGTIRIDRV